MRPRVRRLLPRFLRRGLPSWNAHACSSIHLKYMDPMSSGCPCGELGNASYATASSAPPSKSTTHGWQFTSGVNSDHIGRKASFLTLESVHAPAVTLAMVGGGAVKQKGHVQPWQSLFTARRSVATPAFHDTVHTFLKRKHLRS